MKKVIKSSFLFLFVAVLSVSIVPCNAADGAKVSEFDIQTTAAFLSTLDKKTPADALEELSDKIEIVKRLSLHYNEEAIKAHAFFAYKLTEYTNKKIELEKRLRESENS